MKQTVRIIVPILIVAMILPVSAFAKPKSTKRPGYRISMHIDGSKDDTIYLGYYSMKGGTYALDTAINDRKGNFVFNGDSLLYQGLYFLTNTKGKYVDFCVHKEPQNFTFTTKDDDWARHIKVTGSPENTVFYAFQAEQRALKDDVQAASKRMSKEEFETYRTQQLDKNDSLIQKFIEIHPDLLFTRMMKSTIPIDVPLVNDRGDSLTNQERYEYYAEHYFDNIPIDEDFMLRTPENVGFNKKLENYFNETLKYATPEFIISHVDAIIDRARTAPEMFKYLVHTTAERYLQSNVMVYDEVYVHMIHRYYATGEAVWASPSSIDENVHRADIWEKILVGKTAPELILKDTMGTFHSLRMECSQHQYTLLIFWSPTCGHCKVTIPEMHEIYEKYKKEYDIAAFAILSEPDDATRPKWKKFINQHELGDWLHLDGGEANVDWKEVYDVITTPKIFLLDRERKILFKKFSSETLEGIIKSQLKKVGE